MLEITDKIVPTDAELKEAIALRCSECFPALNVAHGLSGSEDTTAWKLLYSYTPVDLIKEAQERKIDLALLPCAVGKDLVVDSQLYKKVLARLGEKNVRDS